MKEEVFGTSWDVRWAYLPSSGMWRLLYKKMFFLSGEGEMKSEAFGVES
jgi:hypothetical protein